MSDTEIAVLEKAMRPSDPGYRDYVNDPAAQERYRSLIEARESGTRVPARDPHTAEIQRLEKDMRPRSPGYREYLRDGQQRYRELVGSRDGTGAPLAELDAARTGLPAPLVAEWSGSALGFAGQLVRAQEAAGHVLACIPDADFRREFEISFDTLPMSARVSILRAAAEGAPAYSKAADQLEVDGFASLGAECVAMVRAWGSQASRRVGIVLDRFERAVAGMAPADRAKFGFWWSHITDSERGAVAWVLSGRAAGR